MIMTVRILKHKYIIFNKYRSVDCVRKPYWPCCQAQKAGTFHLVRTQGVDGQSSPPHLAQAELVWQPPSHPPYLSGTDTPAARCSLWLSGMRVIYIHTPASQHFHPQATLDSSPMPETEQ